MSASRLLARAWLQDRPAWTATTAAVLGLAMAALLLTGGAMQGMLHETEERTAAFFTGETRIAKQGGVAPEQVFKAADVAWAGDVRMQFESQIIVGRSGFLAAAATETDGFDVDAPGSEGGGYAAGAIIGVTPDAPLGDYLLWGDIPVAGDGPAPVLISLDRLHRILSPAERAAIPWPPGPDDLQGLRLEMTAARLEGNRTLAEGGMVRVRSAEIVGIFDTGVELLDRFTIVAPIEDVRALHGLSAGGNVAISDASLPARPGWVMQDKETFTAAYAGQLIGVLVLASRIATLSLFAVPAALLAHGLTSHLARNERHIAVSRALGMDHGHVVLALAWATAMLLAGAAALAAVVVAVGALALPHLDAPLPMAFHPGAGTWTLVILSPILVGSLAILVAGKRIPMPSVLRT